MITTIRLVNTSSPHYYFILCRGHLRSTLLATVLLTSHQELCFETREIRAHRGHLHRSGPVLSLSHMTRKHKRSLGRAGEIHTRGRKKEEWDLGKVFLGLNIEEAGNHLPRCASVAARL